MTQDGTKWPPLVRVARAHLQAQMKHKGLYAMVTTPQSLARALDLSEEEAFLVLVQLTRLDESVSMEHLVECPGCSATTRCSKGVPLLRFVKSRWTVECHACAMTFSFGESDTSCCVNIMSMDLWMSYVLNRGGHLRTALYQGGYTELAAQVDGLMRSLARRPQRRKTDE